MPAKPRLNWIPYCTGHYKHEACLKQARELRQSGQYKAVRIGSTVREWENGSWQKYSKIYVAR